ncbi:MAG: 23S rRNA (pseudouridine(1915)-N(3))-methyltransferase RlmH [Zhengella sp.]|uniref:23S rRNA (pseudouridine(1915)-N(3))-methyltransferase RlmH n=1 Tax=Zhengella sp. TaxID=2282762 RepID=UPI001D3B7BAA|nr:23S rRNA (pseudouridine(1915)-N(3))-methyltransferase RlmH [Notoacmeibacter sp.]MCC0027801.1 23S rRNA (pseudouridine(1915)-N(3))-methyltransferase RlmH [Brucellaceae bacterium]
MRIVVHAVGRMKAGPERDLSARYFERFAKAGSPLGLDFAGVKEMAESRAPDGARRKAEEAEPLLRMAADGAFLVLLDETGKSVTSADFAERLASLRDEGPRDLVLAIGGPDGHDPALRGKAGMLLSFGRMTWPHQIARILLAEQLYRACTILSGHPYHRA